MPSRARYLQGWGRSKPGIGARAVSGHPLAPFAAVLYNEGGGTVARTWSRTGLRIPTWGAGAQLSSTAPLWCADGADFTGTNFQMLTAASTLLNFNRNFSVVVRGMFRATGVWVCWPSGGYAFNFGPSSNISLDKDTVVNVFRGVMALTAGRFYTLGFTVSAPSTATFRGYIDGLVDVVVSASATFSSSNDIRIGAGTTGTPNTATAAGVLNGRIGWIYWFDRELTAPEMLSVHHEPFAWIDAGPPRRLVGASAAIGANPAALLPAM